MQCSTPELIALSLFQRSLKLCHGKLAVFKVFRASSRLGLPPNGLATTGFVQLGQLVFVGRMLLGIGLNDGQYKARQVDRIFRTWLAFICTHINKQSFLTACEVDVDIGQQLGI